MTPNNTTLCSNTFDVIGILKQMKTMTPEAVHRLCNYVFRVASILKMKRWLNTEVGVLTRGSKVNATKPQVSFFPEAHLTET